MKTAVKSPTVIKQKWETYSVSDVDELQHPGNSELAIFERPQVSHF